MQLSSGGRKLDKIDMVILLFDREGWSFGGDSPRE